MYCVLCWDCVGGSWTTNLKEDYIRRLVLVRAGSLHAWLAFFASRFIFPTFGRRTSVTGNSDDGHVIKNMSVSLKIHVIHRKLLSSVNWGRGTLHLERRMYEKKMMGKFYFQMQNEAYSWNKAAVSCHEPI